MGRSRNRKLLRRQVDDRKAGEPLPGDLGAALDDYVLFCRGQVEDVADVHSNVAVGGDRFDLAPLLPDDEARLAALFAPHPGPIRKIPLEFIRFGIDDLRSAGHEFPPPGPEFEHYLTQAFQVERIAFGQQADKPPKLEVDVVVLDTRIPLQARLVDMFDRSIRLADR